uniref:Keratin n=1 Tax=Chelonoidis abingdonii TaxID=106734 RepID=A0A8C0IVE2_CHEAB
MSFNGVPCNDQCHNPCEVTCPQPIVNSSNQPCVVSCGDSRVVIYPPPVVVTFPGPILSTCPQDSIVGSSAPSGSRISGSVSVISSTPGVTGCSKPYAESIFVRSEPQYTPKYSYTYSSPWIHPGKKSGSGHYRSSYVQKECPRDEEQQKHEKQDSEQCS